MRKPKLLDLFCGAGGASIGYHRAGFEVVGVDIQPQPRYPFRFHQADALRFDLAGFDVIHASPPCQHYSQATPTSCRQKHPDLIAQVRNKLSASGKPYVIENVKYAPLRGNVIMLCGSMFGLREGDYYLARHRYFEIPFLPLTFTPHCAHAGHALIIVKRGVALGGYRISKNGHRLWGQTYYPQLKAVACRLMGMNSTNTNREIGEAIPPAYTEFLGRQLIQTLGKSDV